MLTIRVLCWLEHAPEQVKASEAEPAQPSVNLKPTNLRLSMGTTVTVAGLMTTPELNRRQGALSTVSLSPLYQQYHH